VLAYRQLHDLQRQLDVGRKARRAGRVVRSSGRWSSISVSVLSERLGVAAACLSGLDFLSRVTLNRASASGPRSVTWRGFPGLCHNAAWAGLAPRKSHIMHRGILDAIARFINNHCGNVVGLPTVICWYAAALFSYFQKTI
jgi:hypothetical protein